MLDRKGIHLITRGDDMGAFQAGNQAIINAYKHGILRNASIMMPAPYLHEAIELAKGEPGLCLGLHITLTSEWDVPRWGPLSPQKRFHLCWIGMAVSYVQPMKFLSAGW
ncbi:ChbG/HpnK family deacetylase [Dictyobacter kobayashii]|uniref:ChbG/HpnK family deacetylase n=1 Tax=Dictyobacter kobayashii TaxID=2014872 RepID=A0A402AWB2_9CHLR|nr:ChbG/HpnK family deacetylase [Dictyobacter kobayashii]GCE23379.1 hypothetical protein KDK_71790 [Dictyobacter kobayashii]